jgi:hypothetical protein
MKTRLRQLFWALVWVLFSVKLTVATHWRAQLQVRLPVAFRVPLTRVKNARASSSNACVAVAIGLLGKTGAGDSS